MYLSATILVITAATPLISAHDGVGIPKIAGLEAYVPQTRDLFHSIATRFAEDDPHKSHALANRQGDNKCGEGIGSCGKGECCSRSGFCGTADAYCYSPGCDYKFGPGCPENHPPAGTNTSSVSREKKGSIAYGGTGIFKCKKPGMVALTYDDGPMKTYTSHILDLLKSHDAKATFFITGNNINKGQIDVVDEYKNVIKRMDSEGHQIASHTWTHLDLSKVSSVDRKNQLWMNEMAIRNIVNKIPTYMRPPFSSCDTECSKDMADLGYHVTYFDLNGDDYDQNSKEKIQLAKDWFQGNLSEVHSNDVDNRRLSISHDILEQTANNLTEFMLNLLTEKNLKSVTVGECLGDPKENWYRDADGAGTSTKSGGNTTANATVSGTPSGTSSGTPSGTQAQSASGSTTGAAKTAGSQALSYCGPGILIAFALSLMFTL